MLISLFAKAVLLDIGGGLPRVISVFADTMIPIFGPLISLPVDFMAWLGECIVMAAVAVMLSCIGAVCIKRAAKGKRLAAEAMDVIAADELLISELSDHEEKMQAEECLGRARKEAQRAKKLASRMRVVLSLLVAAVAAAFVIRYILEPLLGIGAFVIIGIMAGSI